MRFRTSTQLIATACLCVVQSLSSARADDPATGVVRISDNARQIQQAGHLIPGHKIPGQYHPMPAYNDGGYGYAYGAMGHGGGCPHCNGGGCSYCSGKGGHGWFKDHYCTHSACHGYSIPDKWPIYRRGVEYTNYYPQQWLGANGYIAATASTAPMVYTPTDTTQLGFYYQHVPFWQPRPSMLPPRPIPSQWHHYAPTVSAATFDGGLGYGGGMTYECPVNPTTPTTIQPVPDTVPQGEGVPPAPLMESAAPTPIQRAGF